MSDKTASQAESTHIGYSRFVDTAIDIGVSSTITMELYNHRRNKKRIFLLIPLFLLCGFCYIIMTREKYLALPINTGGRLGNQMFTLISGYAISKQLGRKFFINYEYEKRGFIDTNLELLRNAFPKLSQIYEVKSPLMLNIVPFAHEPNGRIFCCRYEDPSILSTYTDAYLVAENPYVQNYKYFEKIEKEVRNILEFSPNLLKWSDDFANKHALKPEPSLLCVHIRRTDFIIHHGESTFESTTSLIEQIGREQKLRRLMSFGDDQDFMKNVTNYLIGKDIIDKNSLVSSYSESEDFVLSHRFCKSFILTAPASTFGFWLAFFNNDQQKVYYYEDSRVLMDKVIRQELYPPTWKAVQPLRA